MNDPLDAIAALLSAASTTSDREARVVYLATARAKLEAVRERVKQLGWLLESAERSIAGGDGPAQRELSTGHQ